MRANTLAQAFENFNPRKPLQGESLKAFYVERAGTPLPEMAIGLEHSSFGGPPAMATEHVARLIAAADIALATCRRLQWILF